MFRFTLTGRVVQRLICLNHTMLLIDSGHPTWPCLVSCTVRDDTLKAVVDRDFGIDSVVSVEGEIEWFMSCAERSACFTFFFIAETVEAADTQEARQ
jgi:hypothetical protein